MNNFVLINYNNWYYNNQQKHLHQNHLMNLVYMMIHILSKFVFVDSKYEGYFSAAKKRFKKIFLGINLTTQAIWDDVQVAAETNEEVLSKGSGHGSHFQQLN